MLLVPAAGSAQVVGFAGSGVALWGVPELSSCFGIRAFFSFLFFVLPYRFSSSRAAQLSCLLPTLAPCVCTELSPRLAAGEPARRQSWSGRNVPRAAGTALGCREARGSPGCRTKAALGCQQLSAGRKGTMEDEL